MSEFKRVKGEWKLSSDRVNKSIQTYQDSEFYVNSIDVEGHYAGIVCYSSIPKEGKKTAQLISAAPEMIEALLMWETANVLGDAQLLSEARIKRNLAIDKALKEWR